MKLRVIFFLLILALFLTSCLRDKTTDYSAYSQPQQQDPYVGSGCSVTPVDDNFQPENIISNPTL